MKTLFLVPAALALLAGCATDTPHTGEQAAAREERYVPTGSLLPRRSSSQMPNNVSTMDKTELENAQRINAGAINSPR